MAHLRRAAVLLDKRDLNELLGQCTLDLESGGAL
jgi:hypothetical protein